MLEHIQYREESHGGKDGNRDEISLIYKEMDPMSEYTKNDGSQLSHYWNREFQV